MREVIKTNVNEVITINNLVNKINSYTFTEVVLTNDEYGTNKFMLEYDKFNGYWYFRLLGFYDNSEDIYSSGKENLEEFLLRILSNEHNKIFLIENMDEFKEVLD